MEPQFIPVKKKHFEDVEFKNPHNCPIGKALTEFLGKEVAAFESYVSDDIRSYPFKCYDLDEKWDGDDFDIRRFNKRKEEAAKKIDANAPIFFVACGGAAVSGILITA